jgi:hypothetical protein
MSDQRNDDAVFHSVSWTTGAAPTWFDLGAKSFTYDTGTRETTVTYWRPEQDPHRLRRRTVVDRRLTRATRANRRVTRSRATARRASAKTGGSSDDPSGADPEPRRPRACARKTDLQRLVLHGSTSPVD